MGSAPAHAVAVARSAENMDYPKCSDSAGRLDQLRKAVILECHGCGDIMKVTILALILTSAIVAGPIRVTGGGSGESGFSFPDFYGSWHGSFEGGNADAIYVGAMMDSFWPGDCGPSDNILGFSTSMLLAKDVYIDNPYSTGSAFIGSLESHYFSVQFGGDTPGFLTLFDSSHNELASVDLIGYVQRTSFVTMDCRIGGEGPPCFDSIATFSITATPEPSTASALLLGGGMLTFLLRRSWRRSLLQGRGA